ncbi:hypothetical protein F5X99DRAFT_242094 [Biscogniauxia marginata]|nr:hypothetical protein F5X99DRAFT_242094 [Biscogniauxia marginata]
MTTTIRSGQFTSSELDPPLTTHFTPDSSCTGWQVNTSRGSGSGFAAFTSEVCGTMRTVCYSSTSSDIVATGYATALYLTGPTVSPRLLDPIPTTFTTATRSPSNIVPSSSCSPVRLVSRSASENSTNIGAGVGGGLGGAALLSLGIYLLVRYRKKRATKGEEDKSISPEPDRHHGCPGSQPKPERTPSPISGPEVSAKKPESAPHSDRQGHVESMPSEPIELEAAPVMRGMSPAPQGEGHYIDRSAEDIIIQSQPPVPAELPGSEVSIAELESPHLTATSPITTITAISTTSTATTTTTAPTVTRTSSGRGENQPPAQRAASPRTPASHISRAISPSLSMFSYSSAAPSEIHTLNEDTPRVLNPEERRRQLLALQEEARRREEAPPRRI